jgi:glutaminase
LNQAVVNYLDIADTVEKCDEFLSRVMVQIEEQEAKFADFEEFVLELTGKREEVYNAFEARKQTLTDKRNKKTVTLMNAAERIIKGIENRLQSYSTINEITVILQPM